MDAPDGHRGGGGVDESKEGEKEGDNLINNTAENVTTMVKQDATADENSENSDGTVSTAVLRVEIPYPKGQPPAQSVCEIMNHVIAMIYQVRYDIKIQAVNSGLLMSEFRLFESAEQLEQFFTIDEASMSSSRDQTTVFINLVWDSEMGQPITSIFKDPPLSTYLRESGLWLRTHRMIRRSAHSIGLVFCKHPNTTFLPKFDEAINKEVVSFANNNPAFGSRLQRLWDGQTDLIETHKRIMSFELPENGTTQYVEVELLEWKCARGTGNVVIDILAALELDDRFFGGFKPHPRKNRQTEADLEDMIELVRTQIHFLNTHEHIVISGLPYDIMHSPLGTEPQSAFQMLASSTYDTSGTYLFTDIAQSKSRNNSWVISTTKDMNAAATKRVNSIIEQIRTSSNYQKYLKAHPTSNALLSTSTSAHASDILSKRAANLRNRFQPSGSTKVIYTKPNKRPKRMLLVDTVPTPAANPPRATTPNKRKQPPAATTPATLKHSNSAQQTSKKSYRDATAMKHSNESTTSSLSPPQTNPTTQIESWSQILQQHLSRTDSESHASSKNSSLVSSIAASIASAVQEQVQAHVQVLQAKTEERLAEFARVQLEQHREQNAQMAAMANRSDDRVDRLENMFERLMTHLTPDNHQLAPNHEHSRPTTQPVTTAAATTPPPQEDTMMDDSDLPTADDIDLPDTSRIDAPNALSLADASFLSSLPEDPPDLSGPSV
jgi:hypothetical protein